MLNLCDFESKIDYRINNVFLKLFFLNIVSGVENKTTMQKSPYLCENIWVFLKSFRMCAQSSQKLHIDNFPCLKALQTTKLL